MGYFQVKYDSRVVIYERKMFIRSASGKSLIMYDYKVENYDRRTYVGLATCTISDLST